jgi:hypothetical protein
METKKMTREEYDSHLKQQLSFLNSLGNNGEFFHQKHDINNIKGFFKINKSEIFDFLEKNTYDEIYCSLEIYFDFFKDLDKKIFKDPYIAVNGFFFLEKNEIYKVELIDYYPFK